MTMVNEETRETVTTKYAYDGAGNRVNAKVELNGSLTSNTTYVLDGESSYNDIIMAKYSVNGKTQVFTISDEVISVEISGNTNYYRTDEKHSVTDILDTAGKIKATIEYNEYGVIANPEVVSIGGNIFAYTGHVYEESTGLYYAKARYYDARIGRFVSEDSYRGEANDPASLNLYGYVKNNPVKYTNPSGNSGITITTATIIKLLLAFGGVLSVTYGYLKSKAGRKAINAGARIQYAGIIYNAVTFMKMVRVVTSTKVTTYKAVSEPYTEMWSNATAASLERKAIKARDKEVTKARVLSSDKREDITTIAVGYNKIGGKIAVGINKTSIYQGTLYAEDLVVKQLGGKKAINAIIMTAAIRPRTLSVIPVCKRCQSKYSRKNFVKGAPFA